MRDASRPLLVVIAAAVALAACKPSARENNVAIDINNAAPSEIEQLPPDESVDTSSNELINGADNTDVNADINAPENAY